MSADSVAQDQIRAFVDRILRLKEEAKSINGDIREVYAEAKGNGFDKTVLGKVVSYVEKRASGAADLAEAEALFDLYLSAYDGASHTHAREDHQSTAARKDVHPFPSADSSTDSRDHHAEEPTSAVMHPQREARPEEGAGTQAPPVDTIPEPPGFPPTDPLGSGAATREDAVTAAPEADHSKPNPICRDPDDCGVYASWAMPCETCKRAALAREAA